MKHVYQLVIDTSHNPPLVTVTCMTEFLSAQSDKSSEKSFVADGCIYINNNIESNKLESKSKTTTETYTLTPKHTSARLAEPKKRFGEFVFLSDREYSMLVEKMGKEMTDEIIHDLNIGIGSKGYKYKSHYYTIIAWHNKREKAGAPEHDKRRQEVRALSLRKAVEDCGQEVERT